MIHVHIEVSSVADLQSELSALLGGLSKDTVKAVPQADVTMSQATPADAESDKRIHPADNNVEADEPAPVKDEADGDPQPTMEETRAALNAYRKKNGIAALKELFAAHGVTNFLDLPASEYAAIMKEANAGV